MKVWKYVVGWEEVYKVSNQGDVLRCERVVHTSNGQSRIIPELIMKQSRDSRGYPKVRLKHHDRKTKTVNVHRLVCEAFHENPEKKKTVNHKDGNKRNNNAENLEWMTYKENLEHAVNAGLRAKFKGNKGDHRNSFYTASNDDEMLVFSSTYQAEKRGISSSSISDALIKGRKYLGYTWERVAV